MTTPATTPDGAAGAVRPVTLRRRGPVTLLGLNRPAEHNALDQAMVDEIDRVLIGIRSEPSVLVAHSTSPGVFAAGADIAELVARDADAALRAINAGLFDRIEAHAGRPSPRSTARRSAVAASRRWAATCERAARRAARAAGSAGTPDAVDSAGTPGAADSSTPAVPEPVLPLRVRPLTIDDGLTVAGWSSPGAWRIEDALEAPEPDEGYWAVVDARGELFGLCCLGAAARVPGQTTDDWVLAVAIGIRPQLAGRGWVGDLGRAAVAHARSVAVGRRVRTTVPDRNVAGQHTARQAGFAHSDTRTYDRQTYLVFEQPA